MPIGPIAAGLITTGVSAASNLFNAASQARQNRLQREWNEKMYGRQRQDSLADWNMQNEYNSPTAQMQRLKAAGLNPNLVYGHGANTEAGPIRSTEAKAWNPTAPRIDMGSAAAEGISAYQDARMRDAQINNLKANNTVILEEGLNKVYQRAEMIARTKKTMTDAERSEFDLQLQKGLAEYQIQAADLRNKQTSAQIEQTKSSTQFTIDENARKAAMQTYSLQQAFADLLKTAAETKQIKASTDQVRQLTQNAKIEAKLKELELGLAQKGIYKNDPAYVRVLTRLFNSIGETKPGQFRINELEATIKEYIETLKKP